MKMNNYYPGVKSVEYQSRASNTENRKPMNTTNLKASLLLSSLDKDKYSRQTQSLKFKFYPDTDSNDPNKRSSSKKKEFHL